MRVATKAKLEVYPDELTRPITRGDCKDGPRPCPWVSCRHHLYIDGVNEAGVLRLPFPDLEPWQLKETCSLDIADRGGATLEQVGATLNLTRERVRQIEAARLFKLRARVPHLKPTRDDPQHLPTVEK